MGFRSNKVPSDITARQMWTLSLEFRDRMVLLADPPQPERPTGIAETEGQLPNQLNEIGHTLLIGG